jgi:hypothetical protein
VDVPSEAKGKAKGKAKAEAEAEAEAYLDALHIPRETVLVNRTRAPVGEKKCFISFIGE